MKLIACQYLDLLILIQSISLDYFFSFLPGLCIVACLLKIQQLQSQNTRLKQMVENSPGMPPFQEIHKPKEKKLLADCSFVEKLNQIIDQHLQDENLNLSLICRELGISRTQIYKKLKAATGKSWSTFIKEKRMNEAMILLKTTQIPIGEIAFRLGYKEPGYFSRVFTSENGKTPRKWRQEYA